MKNNIKYILILGLGFFWCSSAYLTQEQHLFSYADSSFVNIVDLLFASFAMALGIWCYSILYRLKQAYIKRIYIAFVAIAALFMAMFFMTSNVYIMSICLCATCFFGTAGFGAGYHFSLVSAYVPFSDRGRVFAFGYALGSAGTYLVVGLPQRIYTGAWSLLIYIPAVVTSLLLVYMNTDKFEEECKPEKLPGFKTYFIQISVIVIAMSLLSALSTDIIAMFTISVSGGYGSTRLYYCLGLIIAGYLADKNNTVFEVTTIASFVVSLLAVIMLNEGKSIGVVAALSYTFVAFFVLYRTMSFVKMPEKFRGTIGLAGFGLMYSRVIEGLTVIIEEPLIDRYLLLITIICLMLIVVIILYFLINYTLQNRPVEFTDMVKKLTIEYGLSRQEEKVLGLMADGKSNQEIADELFISVYTVKRHCSNIYQKTGMKKKELVEKCYK